MGILKNFTNILCGEFDNSIQLKNLEKSLSENFPYAKHINTICNNKIQNIPNNFEGIFMLEESYYTVKGRTNPMPHLFLFTEDNGKVILNSYEMPEGYTKDTFTYKNIENIDFNNLKLSEKFTPAIYEYKNGVWEGGSVSNFTPVMKFTLFEKFSEEVLEVSESIEVNGKRTFGYDIPIEYRRI